MANIMRAQQHVKTLSHATARESAILNRNQVQSRSGAKAIEGGDGEEEEEADMENDEEFVPEIWRPYVCHSLDFGLCHPGSIVEAAALAAIRLPKHTYPLEESLTQQIADGSLSNMQLEGTVALQWTFTNACLPPDQNLKASCTHVNATLDCFLMAIAAQDFSWVTRLELAKADKWRELFWTTWCVADHAMLGCLLPRIYT